MGSDDALKILSTAKIPNLNYEADVKHTLRYTRYFLGLLGIWPMVSQSSTKMEKHVSKLLILICFVSPAFILIPTIHYMIQRERNITARIVLLNPITYFVANFVKYIFIVFRSRTLKLCVQHVNSDWMMIENGKERETMKRNVKVGHDLTIMCSVFMYSCGMSYHTVMPFWSGVVINEFNETVRPLAYPGFDSFVELQSSPTYEIVFCTITVSAFVSFTVSTASCNIAAIFVTHACGQIQILLSRLGGLVDEVEKCRKNNDTIRRHISFLVQCHVRLLRLASNIDVILREICLIEVVASTFSICLLEYCFMMELDNSGVVGMMTYLVSLISLCFNIYIFCHIGELLKDHFHQVGEAAYMIEWYRLPLKIRLDMAMIIIIANCPRKITAGSMIQLTFTSFGSVIKMSMTYFNMLRQLSD